MCVCVYGRYVYRVCISYKPALRGACVRLCVTYFGKRYRHIARRHLCAPACVRCVR